MLTPAEKIELLTTDLGDFLANLEGQAEQSIHGIRKRSKYIRALLKLCRGTPPNLTDKMKSINRHLAPYRDAQVLLDTFLLLQQSARFQNYQALEQQLQQNPFLVSGSLSRPMIEIIQQLLFDFNLQLNVSKTEVALDLIQHTLQETFLSGKKLFGKVQDNPGSKQIHRWRKSTKRLWYQLRYLYGEKINQPDHPLMYSNSLGEILGRIHDLDNLEEILDSERHAELLTVLSINRKKLLAEALMLGEHLYSHRSLMISV